jgi:hypothetical protein
MPSGAIDIQGGADRRLPLKSTDAYTKALTSLGPQHSAIVKSQVELFKADWEGGVSLTDLYRTWNYKAPKVPQVCKAHHLRQIHCAGSFRIWFAPDPTNSSMQTLHAWRKQSTAEQNALIKKLCRSLAVQKENHGTRRRN